LLRIDSGEIWFDGKRVDQLHEGALESLRQRVGMCSSRRPCFDSMTLAENVALPLRKHHGMRQSAALDEAKKRLAQVYMAEYADRYPAELSDGMRKRAAIAGPWPVPRSPQRVRRARDLAEVVLFDEPTTGLDPVSARRVDRLIRELAKSLGVTAVVVSHDPPSIFGIADRVAFIYQGIVHVVATPAELKASSDEVVQQFINGRSSGPMETPGF